MTTEAGRPFFDLIDPAPVVPRVSMDAAAAMCARRRSALQKFRQAARVAFRRIARLIAAKEPDAPPRPAFQRARPPPQPRQ
jgi:hypothetical protein